MADTSSSASTTPDDPQRGAPAAQPDLLGGAARNDGALEPLREDAATRAPRAAGDGARGGDRGDRDSGEARPGADENQAGFVKDADKHFQP